MLCKLFDRLLSIYLACNCHAKREMFYIMWISLYHCSNIDGLNIHSFTMLSRTMILFFIETGSLTGGGSCSTPGGDDLEKCRGVHLKVTTLPYSYISTVTLNASSNTTQYGGLAFDIFNSFINQYNISYDVEPPSDSSWGMKSPNGSWTGMMGMMVHGDTDIGVTEFAVSVHRANDSLVSESFSTTYYVLVLKTPPKWHGRFLFLQPLSYSVWIAFVCSTMLVANITYGVYYLTQNPGVPYCGWCLDIVGTMFNEAVPYFDRRLTNCSLMITMAFWWIGVCVLLAHYNANLKAIFATPIGIL